MDIEVLIYLGRERRALLKASLALQNRLRAHLTSLHAVLGDQKFGESHKVTVPAWLQNTPPRFPVKVPKSEWKTALPALLAYSPVAQHMLLHCAMFDKENKIWEKRISDAAKTLPIYSWVESVPGLGALGIGLLLCETGDLANYATHYRVWKRMGVAVIDGQRQRKTTDKTLAELMGYNPQRRAALYRIADPIIKQNKHKDGSPGWYRQLYLDRKALERERHPELSLGHTHARAARYMSKILLKHIWQQWRKCHDETSGTL